MKIDANAIILIAALTAAAHLIIAIVSGVLARTRMSRVVRKELSGKASLDAQRLESIEELCRSTQKALVLAQSKDAESRKALLDLLAAKNPEVKPKAEETKRRIEKKEKARKETVSKVEGPYQPID